MKFILAKKLSMTQIFNEDGKVVPVTRLQAGPCQITQVKKDAVQVGFGKTREYLLKKPQLGHLKGLNPVKTLKEFRLENTENFKKGDEIALDTFESGEKVTVSGVSKGKGFQGVVKRHGFKGSKATHGNKDQLRAPGSIGATGPQKVFKGLRMAGRMGGDQITVNNLEIVKVDPETQEIFVKGAVPGARNGVITIFSKDGNLKIKTQNLEDRNENPEEKTEELSEETTVEDKKEEVKEEKPVEENEGKDKAEVKEEVKSEDIKEEVAEAAKEEPKEKKEDIKEDK